MAKNPDNVDWRARLWKSGKTDAAALLEQYRLYVESALQVTAWRNSANVFHLSLNSTLLAAQAYLLTRQEPDAALLWIGIAIGLVLAIHWFGVIRHYRLLNSAKFDLIEELEQHLPAALFAAEDLRRTNGTRKPILSKLEQVIPGLFALAQVALACRLAQGV